MKKLEYKILEKFMTFDETLDYVKNQNKWRLPTKLELQEIVETEEQQLGNSCLFYDLSNKKNERVNAYSMKMYNSLSVSSVLKLRVVLVLNEKYKVELQKIKNVIENKTLPEPLVETIRYVLNI